MDTSRVDGVKAPQHRGTPRSHQHDVARVRVRVEEALAEQRDADGVMKVIEASTLSHRRVQVGLHVIERQIDVPVVLGLDDVLQPYYILVST